MSANSFKSRYQPYCVRYIFIIISHTYDVHASRRWTECEWLVTNLLSSHFIIIVHYNILFIYYYISCYSYTIYTYNIYTFEIQTFTIYNILYSFRKYAPYGKQYDILHYIIIIMTIMDRTRGTRINETIYTNNILLLCTYRYRVCESRESYYVTRYVQRRW